MKFPINKIILIGSVFFLTFVSSDDAGQGLKVDKNGYVVYCPCMGKLCF